MYWRNVKLVFHQSSTGKGGEELDLEIGEGRKWIHLGQAIVRAPTYSRCCNLIAGVCWCSVMMKENIWFVFK
jgi:hypothetical protein